MTDLMRLTVIIVGFFVCLIGTAILLQGNVVGGVLTLGTGLIIVAVAAGLIEELFNVFADIFSGVFNR